MQSRRDFIKNSIIGAAALSMGGLQGNIQGAGIPRTSSGRRILGANDRIRVAAIGVNSRGKAVASTFARQAGCEISHVCDVDRRAMDNCSKELQDVQGISPERASDFRRVLDDRDVDVVMIATPDHWHVPASVLAMQAGKHVYCEKPVSYCPEEGEILQDAVRKYRRILEVGLQRRSWPNVIEAIGLIKEGAIGKVHFGKAWYTNNRPSIGRGNVSPVPDWLDWDLWQGPAPRVPYKDNYIHYNWHWFWHWGSGEATNNGTHMVDILRWGMELDFTVSVNSMGGRYFFDDDQETPDTQVINLTFKDGRFISYEGRSCNPKTLESNSVGVMFHGDKGSALITGSNGYRFFDNDSKVVSQKYSSIPIDPRNTVNPSDKLDALHINNFLDAIRLGTRVSIGASEGHKSTLLMQLGMISQRVGRTLSTDPRNGHIIGDRKAMKLWSREYAPGFGIKL